MDRTDLHCEEKQDESGLTTQAGPSFSSTFWQKPHSRFVIILSGTHEVPFGIHKDVLRARSPYYHEELATMDQTGFDLVCKLPNTGIEAFGCLQNFIYTGQVYGIKSGDSIPDFSVLFRAWKLAKTLKMARLQTNLLDCMAVRRYHMRRIPSITNIKEVGGDTEEGCPLRIKFIEWMAEYMRDGYEVTAFAKLLPKEILSELCMFMARLPANLTPSRAKVRLPKKRERNHSLDDDAYEPGTSSEEERAPMRRGCVGAVNRDLYFCRCLIDRILSRPGFWARFAKPFK